MQVKSSWLKKVPATLATEIFLVTSTFATEKESQYGTNVSSRSLLWKQK
jgi:hypothetical protein